MSVKRKAKHGTTGPAGSHEEMAARAAQAQAALLAAYGTEAAPPVVREALPLGQIGTLSACGAAEVGEMMRRGGFPSRMALVCELTLPPDPGAAPQLVLAVPQALLKPLRGLAEANDGEEGTPEGGPAAGLALALAACGRARMAVMQPKRPPALPRQEVAAEFAESRKQAPPLEDVVAETLGLLRMAEKCAEDADWVFGKDSPVWMLFLTVGSRLEEAYEAHQSAIGRERAGRKDGVALVLETGAGAGPAWEGGAV